MNERRSEARLLCSQLVTLVLEGRDGSAESHEANLDDISSRGACVETERPVAVGVAALLIASGRSFPGTIRHCTFRETGYFVGIEFETAVRWSSDDFEPEHLLDPQALKERVEKAGADGIANLTERGDDPRSED